MIKEKEIVNKTKETKKVYSSQRNPKKNNKYIFIQSLEERKRKKNEDFLFFFFIRTESTQERF